MKLKNKYNLQVKTFKNNQIKSIKVFIHVHNL